MKLPCLSESKSYFQIYLFKSSFVSLSAVHSYRNLSPIEEPKNAANE